MTVEHSMGRRHCRVPVRRIGRTAAIISSALAGIVLSAGAAQTPQQRPVFRAGAVFVNVDAYPRRDDKVVEGLTQADFEVFEDGKPQAVEHFEFVRIEPNTPDNERRDPNTVEDSNRQAADPRNRVFVVYLDIFHTTVAGSHSTRQPVVTFLTRTIGPTDLFGVMTPEVPVGALTFGRRTETIESSLEKYWDWGERDRLSVFPRNPTESKLMLCPGGEALVVAYREDLTATSLESLMARLGDLRDERKNILFISEGWNPRPARPGAGGGRTPQIPTIGVGPTGQLGIGANRSGDADAAWCDGESMRLAGIDYEQRFRNLLTTANRANVSFYPVDVGGLRTDQVPASRAPRLGENPVAVAEAYRANSARRLEVLRELAINTDGRAVVNTNDLTGAVRKISDDLAAYYLLGYYTSNPAADGKYRRIEVKVKAPGVNVSARRGYLAPTEDMRKAAARPVRESTPVDAELARLSRIRTDARVYSTAVASSTGLDVIVEIASSEFGRGDWKDGAAVKVEVTSSEEGAKPVSAEGRIEPGSRSGIVKVPLATPGAAGWRVRVRVQAGSAGLDDDITVPSPTPGFVGEPAVFRAGAGARSPLRPVADYTFRRTERIHIEWALAKSSGERTARLLSRRGDALPVPVALTERADGDRIMLVADLVLSPLADGDYVVELTAAAGVDKMQRLLAFRVVR